MSVSYTHLVLEHMGKLEFQSEIPVQFLLFMIPYLIVGWDIIYRAVRNICLLYTS